MSDNPDFDAVPDSIHLASALLSDNVAESYIESQILEYAFNNIAQRWYSRKTGRFAAESVVISEMRLHQQATFNVLDSLTTQLYSGSISIEQWQIGVASELKDAHLAQSMFAVGGKNNMTAENWGRVGGTLADEYRYLSQFAQDIVDGKVSEAQALARIKQYGKATQQSYWREYANDTKGKVNWIINPGENCGDCLDLASGSPYKPQDLPTYPGGGATQCRGNCNCTLERIGN